MAWARLVLAVGVVVSLQLGFGPAAGQDKPALAAYQVQLRFRIDASPDVRVALFRKMVAQLQSLGFVKSKGLEGEEFFGDVIGGTVPAATARRLVHLPHVQAILLTPAGYEPPADAQKPVLADIALPSLFKGPRQKDVWDKSRAALGGQGLQEAVGYDHRSFTRVLGWLPAGRLSAVFKGEVQIEVPASAPTPTGQAATRSLPPFSIITVTPEAEGVEPPKEPATTPPAPREQAFRDKVAADLRAYIGNLPEDKQKQELRVEVILRDTTAKDERDDPLAGLRSLLLIEGRLGPLVTGLVQPGDLDALAARPEVSTVRLPQSARPLVLPPPGTKEGALAIDFVQVRPEVIERGPLASLVRRQKPQRTAVVAADFRGAQPLIGKGLPKRTKLIDLTAERREDLQPEPPPEGEGQGAGTWLALALQQVLPAEELYLIRVAADAAYQLEDVARAVAGQPWQTESILAREAELERERVRLEEERQALRIERRVLSNSFGNDPDSVAARDAHRKRQERFSQDEKAFQRKTDAYLGLIRQTTELKGVGTVLVGVSWLDGHPSLPGDPRALRYLDNDLLSSANWIFAQPRLGDREWIGLFRDQNDDGVMEFKAGGADGASQLAFLTWRPYPWMGQVKPSAELPAGAVVQVTVQWREVHSPDWKRQDEEDVYRRPLVPVQIVVLKQRDPSGKRSPADVFEVVARSTELADRLENTPRFAVYQSTARFQVPDQGGRYAIRIEGRKAASTLPPDAVQLPNAETFELHPILRLGVADPATRARGQVVFE